MAKKLILVAGNIGSGKTSLTERIGERLSWRTAYESVLDNPYLSSFYADMRATPEVPMWVDQMPLFYWKFRERRPNWLKRSGILFGLHKR